MSSEQKMDDWSDDWSCWLFLKSRGYSTDRGVIAFRPEKVSNMPLDESKAIDYLVEEWDWSYE